MANYTEKIYFGLTFLRTLGASFICANSMIYLMGKGLNLADLSYLNIVFFCALLVFQAPAGILADGIGRKRIFLSSCLLTCLSFLIYAQVTALWQCFVAEIFSGIGFACLSGALDAWYVEESKKEACRSSLAGAFSRGYQISSLALIVGGLVGSYLAFFDPVLPWVAGAGFLIFTFVIAAILMKESNGKDKENCRHPAMLGILREALAIARKSDGIKFLFILGFMYSFAVMAPNTYWQPFYQDDIPVQFLGFIYALMAIAVVAGAASAKRISSAVGGAKKALVLAEIGTGAGICLAGAVPWFWGSFGMLIIYEFFGGAFVPIKNAYLNERIDGFARATVISLESMVRWCGAIAGMFAGGVIAQHVSIAAALIAVGAVIVAAACLLLVKNETDVK